jgi:uncharacterized membrane protein YfcA
VRTALYIALCIFGVSFLIYWVLTLARERGKREKPTLLDLGIGLVVNFFDALGIGSFATTTFCFKFFRLVRDEDIPGTLNVGVTLPAILEGLLYIAVVDVEPLTLILTIAGATVGASLGAGVVSRLPKRKIQIGMGITLLITAAFGLLVQFHIFPGGGNLLALLRTVHDGDLSVRHEPAGHISHHDGRGCLSGARGQRAVHPAEAL